MKPCGCSWWQFKHTYSKFLDAWRLVLHSVKARRIFFFKNKILVLFKQVFIMKWITHFRDTALIANLQFMTCSLSIYMYKMRVKAKILVRGVRQMNCNEIPDIWQMAVRRFSRVQSMPSCLYKLYWAHWTREVKVASLAWWIEAAFSRTVGRYSAFK